MVAAAVVKLPPFSSSPARTTALPKPTHRPTHAARPAPATGTSASALPHGIAPLTDLLPEDIDDTSTECTPVKRPLEWNAPGLVAALSCTDPDLSGAFIFGYQMNSASNYQTSWVNFNKWWGFVPSVAGPDCPPSGGSNAEGTTAYSNPQLPSINGQVLECETVTESSGTSAPAYTWSLPSEYTFIEAVAPGSSFKQLDSWWTANGAPGHLPSPAASPTAGASPADASATRIPVR
jgi:hypothetical protein